MTEKKVRLKIQSIIAQITMVHMADNILHSDEEGYDHRLDDVIEYHTDGILRDTDGRIELEYAEGSEMGMENTSTTLIFDRDDPNFLNMARTGENKAGFIFSDKTKRQPCSYSVGGYSFDFVIYTRSIDNRILTDGILKLDYVIEHNGVKTQRNRFTVKVDELKD